MRRYEPASGSVRSAARQAVSPRRRTNKVARARNAFGSAILLAKQALVHKGSEQAGNVAKRKVARLALRNYISQRLTPRCG